MCVCLHYLVDENQSTLPSPVFGTEPFPVLLKNHFACIVSSPLTTSLTYLIRLPASVRDSVRMFACILITSCLDSCGSLALENDSSQTQTLKLGDESRSYSWRILPF